MTYRWTRS
uniref:Uncharacterized protein n=1 Tax=Arundo donax TaxID=35708 RepID=A0A0A9HAE7_ARUDO